MEKGIFNLQKKSFVSGLLILPEEKQFIFNKVRCYINGIIDENLFISRINEKFKYLNIYDIDIIYNKIVYPYYFKMTTK